MSTFLIVTVANRDAFQWAPSRPSRTDHSEQTDYDIRAICCKLSGNCIKIYEIH